MVTLPAGFDLSSLVADFSALGVYVVGAYVLIAVGNLVLKTLSHGGK